MHQTMWHPLHPQRTNHLTFMSKKNPLLVCPSPMNFQLSSTPLYIPDPPQLIHPLSPPVQGSLIGKTCPEDVQFNI